MNKLATIAAMCLILLAFFCAPDRITGTTSETETGKPVALLTGIAVDSLGRGMQGLEVRCQTKRRMHSQLSASMLAA